MAEFKNNDHFRQISPLEDDIKAKRCTILEWGIENFPESNTRFLKKSFSCYSRLVMNINSSANYGVGVIYYLGHVGNFEKNDRVIEQAACMDILQISFTMYAYLMRYTDLREASKVKNAILSLPHADAMLQERDDDNALRGLLGCISDYVMILVMKYLDTKADNLQEDTEFRNQVFTEFRNQVFVWYFETLIKIYKESIDGSSDRELNNFIFKDAYTFGQRIGEQVKRLSKQDSVVDRNEHECIIREFELEAGNL